MRPSRRSHPLTCCTHAAHARRGAARCKRTRPSRAAPCRPRHPPDACCPARHGGQACRRQLFEWCTALRALPSAGLKDKIRLKLCRSGLSAAPPALPALSTTAPAMFGTGVRVGVRPRALATRHTRAERAGACPDTER